MIVFDLRCPGGHVFEAWFAKSADYDDQSARGLIACPICGVADVSKAVMAPAIPGKSNRGDVSPAQAKAMLGKLADAQARALASSDYVGERFADEARAIHLGEAEARSIHGQATRADAKALVADGVPVSSLPMPFVPPEAKN